MPTIKSPTVTTIQVQSNSTPTQQPQLKRILSFYQLLGLGIGATIGAGIFVVTGVVARNQTGPALFLSYILSACVCILSALCYSEMSSIVPSAGSAYSYVSTVLGQPIGYIIGFDLAFEYSLQTALVTKGFSQHFNQLYTLVFKQSIPLWISTAPIKCEQINNATQCYATGSLIDLPAVIASILITTLVVCGVKKSNQFNAFVVTVKITVVLFVVIAGIQFVNLDNYTPFMPYGFISFNSFTNSNSVSGETVGVVAGSAVVFYAFLGFDSIACQSEDAVNPQKDIPRAIVASVGISTLLYVAVSLVLVGMMKYSMIDTEAPVSAAFAAHGLLWAEFVIALGACIGMTAVMLSFMLAQPRILLSMSRDGYVPNTIYGHIHSKYNTPSRATMLNGTTCAIASFIPYEILIKLVNIGTIIAFTTVCVCVLVLHYKQPHLHRPFKTPLAPVIPILGVLANILLLLQLDRLSWLRYGIWLCVGLVLYFVWGRQNAAVVKAKPEYKELYTFPNVSNGHTIDTQIDTPDDSEILDEIELGTLHHSDSIDYSAVIDDSAPTTPQLKHSHSLTFKKTKNKNGHHSEDHIVLLAKNTPKSDAV